MTNRNDAWKRKRWARAYKSRMDAGYEPCRNCGRTQPGRMQFGHLLPHCLGGRGVPGNLTILCRRCNRRMADRVCDWIVPLAGELDYAEITVTALCSGVPGVGAEPRSAPQQPLALVA